MKAAITKKINQIAEVLNSKKEYRNLSLINGDCGRKIFEIQYNFVTNKSHSYQYHSSQIPSNIESYFESIEFDANGISEILWYLSYIKGLDILDGSINNYFSDFESYLDKSIVNRVKSSNYDLFAGTIGVLNFYSESGILFRKKNLQKVILDHLVKEAIYVDKECLTWNFLLFDNESSLLRIKDETNFGLAHGLPSLITCLLKFDVIFDSITFPLIEKSIRHILNFQSDFLFDTPTLSSFPYRIKNFTKPDREEYKSRLGWCYGDLGIACMLWNAGKRFNFIKWREKSVEIILRSILRRSLADNKVLDGGICHGTAGIAHIYNRFYQHTGNQEIYKAALFWIQKTLEMGKFSDGLAGYKVYTTKGSELEYGLLEGISGIGLVLLGFIDSKTMDWDRSLLISN